MSNFVWRNRKSILDDTLDNWHQRGLVDLEMADVLRADTAAQVKSRSFSSIILLLGAICLAFGVMTFVASNWDAMANLTRIGVLFAGLWVSWLLSMYFKYQKLNWPAEVFVLLACAIFGASIMLIGQIYHIQGEPKDATWLWAIGTIGAALFTRSVPALSLGAILITVWAFMDIKLFVGRSPQLEYMYLAYWLVCALGAWWFSSRFIAHVLALGLGAWLYVFSFSQMSLTGHSMQLFTLSVCGAFVSLGTVFISIDKMRWFKGFEPSMLRYLLAFLGLMLISWDTYLGGYRSTKLSPDYWIVAISVLVAIAYAIYANKKNMTYKYDILVLTIFTISGLAIFFTALFRLPFVSEAYFLAFSIWVVRMGLRLELRSISSLGFLGFGILLLLIYFKTIGSLLDTSLFYFIAGAVLIAGAYFIPRILRNSSGAGEVS